MAEMICVFCGRYTRTKHHLIFGMSLRALSDEDKLTIPLCDEHHNMAVKAIDRIHGNPTAEKLSKMLGQAIWERNKIASGIAESEVRELFIKRYGRSYL